MAGTGSEDGRRRILRHLDLGVGAVMLILAFVGVAASDIWGGGSQSLWTLIALAFAACALALDWLHRPEMRSAGATVRAALHWLAVVAAIELVYVLIGAGRLANADDGLMNGSVLALGAILAGVHGDWRLAVIGVALGLGVAAAALFEQYLWALIALGAIALVTLFLVSRWRGRDRY